MKKLLSAVFLISLSAPSCHHHFGALLAEEEATIAGTWKLSMDSPHGPVQGPLKVEQDGSKLTATYEVEGMGTFHFTGVVTGNKVSFEIPGEEMTLKMTGTVDGDKMSGTISPHDGSWSATRQ